MATSMDESEDDGEMCLYSPGEIFKYTRFCKAQRVKEQYKVRLV